jgi:hypothetical protein
MDHRTLLQAGLQACLAAGIRKTVRVRSDTRITRAGKPIKFAEVGIGNAVTLTDYGTARSRPRMWGVQSP